MNKKNQKKNKIKEVNSKENIDENINSVKNEYMNIMDFKINEIKENIKKLSNSEAKTRMKKLYEEISYHANLYYNQDKPEISDFDYDVLIQEIRFLEELYPEYIESDSLNKNVGGVAGSTFDKVVHEVPMQSLNDVFSYSDIEDFFVKYTNSNEEEFVIETKIDGLSCSLTYDNGRLVLGATRGDGITGELVTENVLQIRNLPKEIDYKGKIILRGEVFISKLDFEIINNKNIEEGKKEFANSRNAAAGSLRQKDSKVVKERRLKIYIFNIDYSDKKFETHFESLNYVKELGFEINPFLFVSKTYEGIIDKVEEIQKLRNELSYGIDGAVIKINNLEKRIELGSTARAPRWAVAYKYPPEQKETKLLDVQFNVGRTGVITPLGILEPVKVDGSTISKTTLHNFEYIKSKDIRILDTVVIQKAGDIIPEVVEVVKEKRTGEEKEISEPINCPVCGSKLFKSEEEIYIRCINLECPEKQLRAIEHFTSRNCMNISGLAEKNIQILLEKEMIKNVSDIYYLKQEDFESLKKNGKKYAENLYNSIEQSKNNQLHRLINALGIHGVGTKLAKNLAKEFKTMDNIISAKEEEFLEIPDFGNIIANNIIRFFENEGNLHIIERLKEAGVNMTEIDEIQSFKLQDLKFVITGTHEVSRKEIEDLIEKNGGKISSSVSKNIDYLIAGENAGSKLNKAVDLEIQIIDFSGLKDILEN